jgi:hypothetical protein
VGEGLQRLSPRHLECIRENTPKSYRFSGILYTRCQN